MARAKTRAYLLIHRHSNLFEYPVFRSLAERFAVTLLACFRVDTYHRLGSRKTITDPRTVFENELQPIGPDDLLHFAAAQRLRIRLHLFSKFFFHFRSQAKVLP